MHATEKQLKCPFPVKALSWRVGSTNKDKTKGECLEHTKLLAMNPKCAKK